MACENEDYSYLIQQCDEVPLHALRVSVRRNLAKYLDLDGSLNGDYCNDYNGLAELAGFTYADIRSFQKQKSPTEQLLHDWGNKPGLNPTCDKLVKYLLQLDRRDVLTDCQKFILKDVETYKRVRGDLQNGRFRQIPPDRDIDQRPREENILSLEEAIEAAKGEKDNKHYWDAFVIYNPEGRDLIFVKKMADILEGPEYNLKLFIPWRDDLPGSARHEVTAELIEKRCRRSLVILSTDFHNSSVADFQLKFAQCLSPGARSKKVVPIRINMCNIPNILKIVTLCDFTKEETIEWAWPRVAAVIKSPLNPSRDQYSVSPDKLKDIKLDTSSDVPREWWAVTVACMELPT